jgi:sigma-B regulation protein RsbU (phosphoserine phosphatase)
MNARVLIADDQQAIHESFRLLLKPLPYEVEMASTPAEVLDAVGSRRFDLLVMDLNYAQGNTSGEEGLNLLQRVEAVDSGLPIVVMTAWSTVEVAVEAMRGPLRDFVQKPWDHEKLLAILRRQIERGRAARAEDRELTEAREIQRRLLPTTVPELPGHTISTAWEPARSVGGDYFDILDLGAKTAFCIGDVVGKGLPAALLMSNVQAAVRVFGQADKSPAEVCSSLNRIICGNIASNKFISFFYGILDTRSGIFAFSNAGHNHPVLVRRDGSIHQLVPGGLALGIDSTTCYRGDEIELHAGDRLLLFTDGLTEAEDRAANQYGDERLHELLSRQQTLTGPALLEHVLQDVRAFSANVFHDDVTAMLLAKD